VFYPLLYYDLIEPRRLLLIPQSSKLNKDPLFVSKSPPDLCSEFGFLSIEDSGGLGNVIGQYATLYGFARLLQAKINNTLKGIVFLHGRPLL
jgi:hypothetical protein